MSILASEMNWLPPPPDVTISLQNLRATKDPAKKIERLIDLARCRLTYLETIQVDNALARIAPTEDTVMLPRVRMAILGSSTAEHLLPSLRVAGLRYGLCLDLYAGSFGQYRQEILEPSASLRDFAPDIILLSVNCAEALANVAIADSKQQVDQVVDKFVGEMSALWRAAQTMLGAAVVQQSILDVTNSMFGSFDRLVPGAPRRVISHINDSMAQAANDEQVFWLDVAAQCARDGLDSWFDPARWLQGKMEIAPQAAMAYGELAARLIAAQRGKSRKCLVLDLDNTLWGGVVGDDGIEGIVLGQGSALGEAHVSLQQYAKALNERGIVLAVCSKNDEETARLAFEKHPEMHLKLADIAVFVANWQDKVDNLISIADRLNIGLDALVFVDDNPVERARVREALPPVAVPELPDDPAQYVPCIAAAGYFEAVTFTADDQQRTRQYAANAERNIVLGQATTIEDFLRDLDMRIEFGPVDSVNLARVTQLINKTNQFNTTTRRLTAHEITAYANDPGNLSLQFRLRDRFGDNGLVSAIIMCLNKTEPHSLDMLNWVMSCRVFGRQLEDEIMNIVVEAVRGIGVRTLFADYVPTGRNKVISELFSGLEFSKFSDCNDGSITWKLDVADYRTRKTFIRRPDL